MELRYRKLGAVVSFIDENDVEVGRVTGFSPEPRAEVSWHAIRIIPNLRCVGIYKDREEAVKATEEDLAK